MPLRRAYQPPKGSYRVSKQIKKFPVYEAAKGPYEDGNNAKKICMNMFHQVYLNIFIL
jgi:hypothetical protein